MSSALRWLGWLWCSPISLVGALFSWRSTKIRDTAIGARIFYAGPPARWLLKLFRANAMSLGWFIYSKFSVVSVELERHESRHVAQQRQQGPLFPLGYYGVMLLLLALGMRPCVDNPYEVAARRAEGG